MKKIFFAINIISFCSTLPMEFTSCSDSGEEEENVISFEYLVDSEVIKDGNGKLSMWDIKYKQKPEEVRVLQIAQSQKAALDISAVAKLRPAIPFQSVQVLRWMDGNLRYIEKNDFRQFPNIEEIVLYSNAIEDIDPAAFECLPKLKKLWLDRNCLPEDIVSELKARLGHLELLDCSNQREPDNKTSSSDASEESFERGLRLSPQLTLYPRELSSSSEEPAQHRNETVLILEQLRIELAEASIKTPFTPSSEQIGRRQLRHTSNGIQITRPITPFEGDSYNAEYEYSE